jgi:DNA-binding CsgD family transcriptional regulator
MRSGNPDERNSDVLSREQWERVRVELELSPRELDVARCVVDELSSVKIARQLDIAEPTVHSHLSRIYQKLGVRGRVGVVAKLFTTHVG